MLMLLIEKLFYIFVITRKYNNAEKKFVCLDDTVLFRSRSQVNEVLHIYHEIGACQYLYFAQD